MAAALALAAGYSFATKLSYGPDEPGHIVYVQSLASDGKFPVMGAQDVYRPGAAISHQVQHPPLYYLLAAGVYRLALPLPESGRIRALRIFSALLGLVSLYLLWALAGLVLPAGGGQRLAAVAALAFLPLFSYMTAVVNNDALVVLLCLAAFYTTVTIMAGDDRLRRCALAGGLTGLAILTKEMALALLPVIAAGLLLPRGEGGPPLRRRLFGAVVAIMPALAIPSAWWIRNLALFGHPVIYAYVVPPFRNTMELFASPDLALSIIWVWAKLSFVTLWAPYWAVKGIIPLTPYVAATGAIAALAAAGLIRLWYDHSRATSALPPVAAYAFGLMIAFAVLVAGGVLRYTLFVDYRTVEGGRYMLVTWPYLAILGTAAFAPLAGRFRAAALTALGALWLTGDVIVLWAVGRTYGAW